MKKNNLPSISSLLVSAKELAWKNFRFVWPILVVDSVLTTVLYFYELSRMPFGSLISFATILFSYILGAILALNVFHSSKKIFFPEVGNFLKFRSIKYLLVYLFLFAGIIGGVFPGLGTGVFIFMMFYGLAAMIFLFEKRGVFESFARSRMLVKDRFWEVFLRGLPELAFIVVAFIINVAFFGQNVIITAIFGVIVVFVAYFFLCYNIGIFKALILGRETTKDQSTKSKIFMWIMIFSGGVITLLSVFLLLASWISGV